MNNVAAFIPARAGSERVANKNIRLLDNKPLIQFTIDQVKKSKIINNVYISSNIKDLESSINGDHVKVYKRPENISKSTSKDIDWVLHLLKKLKQNIPEIIVLLRPTSPFRTSKFIDESIEKFSRTNFDSARAVKLVTEHPNKMWRLDKSNLVPYVRSKKYLGENAHSLQYKSLEKVYVQTSSLEIIKVKSLLKTKTLSGNKVIPIFPDRLNGFTIDYEHDFMMAEMHLKGMDVLKND